MLRRRTADTPTTKTLPMNRDTTTPPPIDLTPLAAIVTGMLARQQEYDRTIELLREARREQRAAADAPLPDLSLDVEREVLLAAGDSVALAAFDAEHGAALAVARQAAADAKARAESLPARIAALEALVKRIAQRMDQETDRGALRREAERIFAPYGTQLIEAARPFIAALRDARAVSDALHMRLGITEYDVFGNSFGTSQIEPLGRIGAGDVVPADVAGIPYETLRDLNAQAREDNAALSEHVHAQLVALGLKRGLRLYRPGTSRDTRHVFVPNDEPKAKRPEIGPLRNEAFIRDAPMAAALRTSEAISEVDGATIARALGAA